MHGDICITYYDSKKAIVWDASTFENLGDLNAKSLITCVSINEEMTVAGTEHHNLPKIS